METTLTTRILANTFSKEAAYARLGVCRQALEAVVYSDDQTKRVEKYTELVLQSDEATSEAVLEWGTDWLAELSMDNFQTSIQYLYDWLETLETFTLYVPVALTSEGESVLGHWCREHVGPQVLLDLEVDPDVVGGCAFIANGSYVKHALRERSGSLPTLIANTVQSYV